MSKPCFLIVGNGHLAHSTMLLLKKQSKHLNFQPDFFQKFWRIKVQK